MQKAIICDLDGTLADLGDRHPFDFENVDRDTVKHGVAEVVRAMHVAGYAIVLLSGREDSSRAKTEAWLAENDIPYELLLMRKTGDRRKDTIVKFKLYETRIKPAYDVLFVLEDRDQVVAMWRDQANLPCFQVAPGAF